MQKLDRLEVVLVDHDGGGDPQDGPDAGNLVNELPVRLLLCLRVDDDDGHAAGLFQSQGPQRFMDAAPGDEGLDDAPDPEVVRNPPVDQVDVGFGLGVEVGLHPQRIVIGPAGDVRVGQGLFDP